MSHTLEAPETVLVRRIVAVHEDRPDRALVVGNGPLIEWLGPPPDRPVQLRNAVVLYDVDGEPLAAAPTAEAFG